MDKLISLLILGLFASLSIASAADVLYIVKNSQGVDNFLINEIKNSGFSVTTVFESSLESLDFSNYEILVIGNQDLENAENIPTHQYHSLIINSYNFYKVGTNSQLGLSERRGLLNSPTTLEKHNTQTKIGENLEESFQAYTISSLNVKTYYLAGMKPKNTIAVVSRPSFESDIILGALNPGVTLKNGKILESRNIFFGIVETKYWTLETKELFANSLYWLLEGTDFDEDGFSVGIDCDDTNQEINPNAEEIPYDGIDQDCNGSDLTDVDKDNFIAEEAGGNDCNDKNPSVNPNSSNPLNNCTNDPVTLIKNIPEQKWDEDSIQTIDLKNYFKDPDSNLAYAASGNDFVNIEFKDDIASLNPKKNWFGTEQIIIKASDEDSFVNSNEITLVVLSKREPPVISDLDCETEINEDEIYVCSIEVSDFENDEVTLSVVSSENLNCEISQPKRTLTYKSEKNQFGFGSCKIMASDQDGIHSKILEVNILPVNDSPDLISFFPEKTNLNLPKDTSKIFSINPTDVDNASLEVKWFINEELQTSTNEFSYVFSKPEEGAYALKAVISDSTETISITWTINIKTADNFSCSEIAGNLCSVNEFCPSTELNTNNNSNLICCSTACREKPPEFKDASTCDMTNNDLQITILDPDHLDEFKLNSNVNIDIEISNLFGKEQELRVKAYLYDLNEKEAIESQQKTLLIGSDRKEFMNFLFKIPETVDLENDYAVFIKAEDEICNQEFQEIKILRPEKKIRIDEFTLPIKASCGETIPASIMLENIGETEQEVQAFIKNTDLNIFEETEIFTLQKYDENNKKNMDFLLKIPANIADGTYEIESVAETFETVRQSKNIEINCANTNSESDENAQIHSNNLPNKQVLEKSNSEFSGSSLNVLALMLVSFINISIILYFLFFLLKKK